MSIRYKFIDKEAVIFTTYPTGAGADSYRLRPVSSLLLLCKFCTGRKTKTI